MKKLLLIIILLLVAATPLLAASTCGDNICRADQNENKLTCPQDCGTLPESKTVFEQLWVLPRGSDIFIQFVFYYDNQTRTVITHDQIYGSDSIWPPLPGYYCHNANFNITLEQQLRKENHCDDITSVTYTHQMINDAKCTFEINNNTFDFTTSPGFGKVYELTLPIVNDGSYNGVVKCRSSLGNVTWPVNFVLSGGRLYDNTISPEKVREHSIQELNSSVYRDYVNLTQVKQEQQIKEKNKPPSFADTMSNLLGLALLGIAIFAYTVLSIIYAIARTIQYLLNIGKGAKPPIAAIAILLTCALAIAFFPMLLLIPVIMTLKIIHKVITLILPKQKTQTTKNKIKIEEI